MRAVEGPTPLKRARVDARVTPEQKRHLERAAALRGQTLSDFIISSAQQAADQAIRDHGIMRLSEQDSLAFVEAFLEPGPPAPRLLQAIERYRAILGDQ